MTTIRSRAARSTASAWLAAGLLASPALAQPPEVAAPSDASLARIRRGLEVERSRVAPALARLDFRDPTLVLEDRRGRRTWSGLEVVGGVDLWTAASPGGAVPMGGPTHRAMLDQMIPDEVKQMASSDVLGIATASAWAAAPYLVRAITGWFGANEVEGGAPLLAASEETVALAGVRTGTEVLAADIAQRGRTMQLSLVVPDGTAPERARALGERFAWLVKATAAAETPPDGALGAGAFDYAIRVSSRSDTVLAEGGKPAVDAVIVWSGGRVIHPGR